MTLKDIAPLVKDALENNDFGIDSVLERIGLQQRRSSGSYVLPALGIFVGGAVMGACLGLFLAPSSGAELRTQIKDQVKNTIDHARETVMRATNSGEDDIEELGNDARV